MLAECVVEKSIYGCLKIHCRKLRAEHNWKERMMKGEWHLPFACLGDGVPNARALHSIGVSIN